MTPEVRAVYERFKAAQDEFFEYLSAVLEVVETPPPPTPRTGTRQPTRVAPVSLPASVTPAPKGNQLTDKVRKDNLPAAKAVALKILKMIGDSPNLTQGVSGQLALERIPYDVTLVQQAIEAARREL